MKNADMPAMPIEGEFWVDSTKPELGVESYQGLTKREIFAMHAMEGLLAANSGWRNSNPMTNGVIANEAVYLADALLSELETKNPA